MRHDNPEASSMFNGERWMCEARSEDTTFNNQVVYAACTSGPDMATLAAVHALTDKSGNVALGCDFHVEQIFCSNRDKLDLSRIPVRIAPGWVWQPNVPIYLGLEGSLRCSAAFQVAFAWLIMLAKPRQAPCPSLLAAISRPQYFGLP